jgi:hypothetical protein
MSLIERDFRRAAQAVIRQQGDGALVSVGRYIMMLRRENRHDLAEYWQRVAEWIEAMKARSIH